MAPTIGQGLQKAVWQLVARQHGVVARRQLLELGLSTEAIQHRLRTGRLHRVHRGVYAVGRPQLTRQGRSMAALLACGSGAVLSHSSAAGLWRLRARDEAWIEVSVPPGTRHRPPGVIVHRRHPGVFADARRHQGLAVTSPVRTLLDCAGWLEREELERMVNEADRLDLTDPEQLRLALDSMSGERGVRPLRELLDRRTFVLTDSGLETRFLALIRKHDLPVPLTRRFVNGFRVDFHWPELGLVVETDGLRYHRTAAQQARDRLRDQAHTAAGLVSLRFTHAQVSFESRHVGTTVSRVIRRLEEGRKGESGVIQQALTR